MHIVVGKLSPASLSKHVKAVDNTSCNWSVSIVDRAGKPCGPESVKNLKPSSRVLLNILMVMRVGCGL